MTRPPIRAVLWDVDGTLVDSEPMHAEATIAVSNAYGATLRAEDGAAMLGLSMRAIFTKMQDQGRFTRPVDYEAWIDAINAHYVANVEQVAPRAGALDWVQRFAARGLAQACVSNSQGPVVAANLRRLGQWLGGPTLAFGISRDDVANGKPHPEPYLTAAARLGLDPSQCAVIEDSPVGAAAGVAAGCTVIAWPMFAELWFEGVHARVDRLDEVMWDALIG